MKLNYILSQCVQLTGNIEYWKCCAFRCPQFELSLNLFETNHIFQSSTIIHVANFGQRFSSALFPLRKKARLLQWVVFFSFFFSWQSYSEWSTFLTICSSFIFVHLPFSTKPESVGSILALNHNFLMLPKVQVRPKGPPLWVCFGTMRLFFENFWILSKGTPCIFWSFRFVENVEWA